MHPRLLVVGWNPYESPFLLLEIIDIFVVSVTYLSTLLLSVDSYVTFLEITNTYLLGTDFLYVKYVRYNRKVSDFFYNSVIIDI